MTTPHEITVKPLAAGEAAPKFKAKTYPAGTIALDDLIGKKNLILAFYPKDMTPGCTKEMCDFSADLSKFNDANTQVIGVSCDSVESHQAFAAKHDLKQVLIADTDASIAQAYGCVREGKLMANRVLFLIDKQGIIRHVYEGMPNNAELLSTVQSLK